MFVRWFHRAHACLGVAVLVTAASTALLVCAVCSEHWEHIAWDRGTLQAAALAQHNWTLDWLLEGQVARLLPEAGPAHFLIPMHSGIWTLCASLDEHEHALLQQLGFPRRRCANFLAGGRGRDQEPRTGWQHRMQNLSISCALVCLILLGSSAVVGAFGVLAHQVSAVLVTGVLYMLAATFATFTLTIIHLKRAHSSSIRASSGSGVAARVSAGSAASAVALADGVLPLPPAALWSQVVAARRVQVAWSLHLGWAGVAASLVTAALWIALSKAMRHTPLGT